MIPRRSAIAAAVGLMILGGLVLWWRWGEAVVLSGPGWLCLPR